MSSQFLEILFLTSWENDVVPKTVLQQTLLGTLWLTMCRCCFFDWARYCKKRILLWLFLQHICIYFQVFLKHHQNQTSNIFFTWFLWPRLHYERLNVISKRFQKQCLEILFLTSLDNGAVARKQCYSAV